jgi:hypothetical protein
MSIATRVSTGLFISALVLSGVSWPAVKFLPISPAIAALSPVEINKKAKEVTVMIQSVDNPSLFGSGVIVSKTGNTYTVLTAYHVLSGSAQYTVMTSDEVQYTLKNVQPVRDADMAIATFESSVAYPVAAVGDSTALQEGQSVYISGFPKASEGFGVVQRQFVSGNITAIIQSSRAIQQGYSLAYNNLTRAGMSGGPVFNEEGQLIAIHGRTSTPDKTWVNMGMPINLFRTASLGQSPNRPVQPAPKPSPKTIPTPQPAIAQVPTPSPTQAQSTNPGVASRPSFPSLVAEPQPNPSVAKPPSPTPAPAIAAVPTPVATPKPVVTPTPSPTVAAVPTPIATPKPVVTPTPSPTVAASKPTPVASPSPVVTPKPAPVASPQPIATPAPVAVTTPKPSPVASPSPKPTPSIALVSPAPVAPPSPKPKPAIDPLKGIQPYTVAAVAAPKLPPAAPPQCREVQIRVNTIVTRKTVCDGLGESTSIAKPQDQPENHVREGNNQITNGNLAQAIKEFTKAIDLKGDYPEAYFNRGYAYYKSGNTKKAIADFSQAAKLFQNQRRSQEFEKVNAILGQIQTVVS